MQKIFFILFFILFPSVLFAREKKIGAGIILGDVIGLDLKYRINQRSALEGVFSAVKKNDFYFHGDYLWHDYRAFPKPQTGEFPLFYGLGAKIISDKKIGIRFPIGIEYIFAHNPFDVFFELAPTIHINPVTEFHFAAGVGFRYYFDVGN